MTWNPPRVVPIVRIVLIALLAAAAGLLVLRADITRDIDAISGRARIAYPGNPDRVLALMSFVADENQAPADRDRAVWALGQLRDSRALPVLWSYVKDAECRHEVELCQRGLAKAVALCEDPGPDLLRVAARSGN